MNEPLKNCPFCGSEVDPEFQHKDEFFIDCRACNAQQHNMTHSGVIKMWNRRTPGPATQAMLDHFQALTAWKARHTALPKEVHPGHPSDATIQAFIDECLTP